MSVWYMYLSVAVHISTSCTCYRANTITPFNSMNCSCLLTAQAHGNAVEVAVGTGLNLQVSQYHLAIAEPRLCVLDYYMEFPHAEQQVKCLYEVTHCCSTTNDVTHCCSTTNGELTKCAACKRWTCHQVC